MADLIVIRPSIEVKSVERYALCTNGNGCQRRANLGVESVAVHAEIARGIPEADKAGIQDVGDRARVPFISAANIADNATHTIPARLSGRIPSLIHAGFRRLSCVNQIALIISARSRIEGPVVGFGFEGM